MEPIAGAVEDASLVFDFPSPKESRPPLIVLDDAAVGYVPGAPVLSGLNLRLDPDDRIALVGRNGNGKTTLAQLLAGQLKPMAGAVPPAASSASVLSRGIRSRNLFPTRRRFSTWASLSRQTRRGPGATRALGFSGNKANVKVSQLSGGERARLSLALITPAPASSHPRRPDDDLDVDARGTLVEALTDFGGAVAWKAMTAICSGSLPTALSWSTAAGRRTWTAASTTIVTRSSAPAAGRPPMAAVPHGTKAGRMDGGIRWSSANAPSLCARKPHKRRLS